VQRKARGQAKALRIVRVPSPEVEDQRALPREREALMHDAQRLRNRIELALFAQGYRDAPKTAKPMAEPCAPGASVTCWIAERITCPLRTDLQ